MKDFDKEQLKALQKLCRIRLEPAEEDRFVQNLQHILKMIESLKEVDTKGVEPCSHVIENVIAPMREDDAERLISREDFLKGAPDQIGGMIKVPKVIKDEL